MPEKKQKSKTREENYRKMLLNAVTKYGDVCESVQDVDQLLLKMEDAHHSQKREAIRSQLNYLKFVNGCRDKRLKRAGFSLSDLVSKLKAILASENQSTNLSSEPEPIENILTGEESQSTSQITPPEPTTSQPSQSFNSTIDIKNKGNFVIFQSYKEKLFEFSPDL